jgi:hypothetical protein
MVRCQGPAREGTAGLRTDDEAHQKIADAVLRGLWSDVKALRGEGAAALRTDDEAHQKIAAAAWPVVRCHIVERPAEECSCYAMRCDAMLCYAMLG